MSENPLVIIELVPPALVGQQHSIQVRHENLPGSWPSAVSMLLEGLKAATNEAFKQLQAHDDMQQAFFVPDDLRIKR